MAANRKPGPESSHEDPLDINQGTIARVRSHPPGPIGIVGIIYHQRGEPEAIYGRAIQRAPAALARETGYVFDGQTMQDVVSVLVQTLKGLISVGSANGKTIDKYQILCSLRLEFLADHLNSSHFGNLVYLVRMGSSVHSTNLRSDVHTELGTYASAGALASAAGILSKLILQSIVAYLLALSSKEANVLLQRTRIPAPTIVSDSAVGELIAKLRSSYLGESFAVWIKKNWKNLLTNLRLRVGSRNGGDQADRVMNRVTSPRSSPRPAASEKQPTPGPPTFSDIRDAQLRQMANSSPQMKMIQPSPEIATWLEIRLVTEDGTPVAGEIIKVQLPDRSIHEVKLNAEGMVRFDNIVGGEASVSFPEIIDKDWRPADGRSPRAS